MKISQEGREITATSPITFGEVEFGMKKDILIEIQNDGVGLLTGLQFKAIPEIHILNAPTKIAPLKSAYLTLSWIPDANVQQPINANLEISGKEVFG